MWAKPDHFVVSSGRCRLAVRSYPPVSTTSARAGVILLHGLLSSADVFDVPGLESMSLARGLQREGFHVVSYDQRGAGESTTEGWSFGLNEHALVDLPAVLTECRRRFGFERVVLLGHSLGGTIWLRYVQSPWTPGASGRPTVVGGVVLASPADFDRAFPPWSDIANRGRGFVESIDRNRDGIVSREEFVAAQVTLYWPWATRLLHPAAIRFQLSLGSRSSLVAGILRVLPLPSLIYHRDDFDNATFQRVLQSKTLDRASQQLMLELADDVLNPAPANPQPPLALRVLCVGSTQDRLVPLRTVEGFARRFTSARVIATETEYGHLSGHVGYLFKAGVRERVLADVVSYLRTAL